MKQKIAIGSDHAGYEMKEEVKSLLEKQGFEITDFGTNSTESTDYPDYAHPVANTVEKGENELGILICGSANGVAMAANKHQGIRAAICWNEELASLARQHNNANILCLPARFIKMELAEKIVDQFLKVSFEGGRHERRVNKISC
ncbi:MAG: ribose 5-phosphate isomerase B [Cyclobacteriaceae bacterium]